ncbi:DUF6933 domain-containing protein [Halopseudomonas pelagia]|uniref:DUF6933 domain-containing protein n=1 Tax=Halopseudomonas pelagia TaxID=553151 RepID=UPI000399A76F|nr:hypothetical protein [Halopseudomonas pelagia]|tara:strand:- start:100 stop:660 length:561 start_codon:yes stop_codon:yes gene_type:complete
MIRLHCTRKLFAKLPLDSLGRLNGTRCPPEATNDAADSLLSGWHANLITQQRRNCVIFIHDATRFPVLITCLTKPDFVELDAFFQDALMNTLLKVGANQAQLDVAASALTRLACDSQCDRSVQGTMNRMALDLDHMLWYDNIPITDLNTYAAGAWLAQRPCGVKSGKECIWPAKAMLALLEQKKTH